MHELERFALTNYAFTKRHLLLAGVLFLGATIITSVLFKLLD